jgi:hypothetical protein
MERPTAQSVVTVWESLRAGLGDSYDLAAQAAALAEYFDAQVMEIEDSID